MKYIIKFWIWRIKLWVKLLILIFFLILGFTSYEITFIQETNNLFPRMVWIFMFVIIPLLLIISTLYSFFKTPTKSIQKKEEAKFVSFDKK